MAVLSYYAAYDRIFNNCQK